MVRVCVVAAAAIWLAAAAVLGPVQAAVQAPSAAAQSATTGTADAHQTVVKRYCVSCHNQRLKTGGLALDALNLADVGSHAEEWEKVIRKVRTGAMPPVGRARPDKDVAAGLATWLETELDRAAFEHVNPGRASLQRLNRQEYDNAVQANVVSKAQVEAAKAAVETARAQVRAAATGR